MQALEASGHSNAYPQDLPTQTVIIPPFSPQNSCHHLPNIHFLPDWFGLREGLRVDRQENSQDLRNSGRSSVSLRIISKRRGRGAEDNGAFSAQEISPADERPPLRLHQYERQRKDHQAPLCQQLPEWAQTTCLKDHQTSTRACRYITRSAHRPYQCHIRPM